MVAHLHQSRGHFIVNYVDDFLGIEYESKVYQAHQVFIKLLGDIGAGRSKKKSVPPT